jgi:carbon storage regulator CsrA
MEATMLVISRTPGTVMMIGDDVEVELVAFRSESADLRVIRRELRGRLTSESDHMLRPNDRIDLGDGCACSLVAILPDRVRLGFTAPKFTPVHRKEVYEALRRKTRGDA